MDGFVVQGPIGLPRPQEPEGIDVIPLPC